MIVGIGVDLVRIDRIGSGLEKHGDRMAERILGEQELGEFRLAGARAEFLAKRFAAKEAMAKALGTGFRDKLSLKHIRVTHDEQGKPGFNCSERALELLDSLGINRIHLSISDEQNSAVAFVVLESLS